MLEDINAFHAGKKRDEALEALADWLPQAERFTAQTKGTKKYIDQLSDANSELALKLQEKESRFYELSIGSGAYAAHVEVAADVDCQCAAGGFGGDQAEKEQRKEAVMKMAGTIGDITLTVSFSIT